MCKDSVQGYRLLLILATDQGFFFRRAFAYPPWILQMMHNDNYERKNKGVVYKKDNMTIWE